MLDFFRLEQKIGINKKKGNMLRLINDFEITIKRLMSEELKNELKCLKESHGSAFIEGGIGKRGKLERNFGARFLIKNNAEGIFVLHKLIELSGGLYEAYARLFITDSDIPVIKCCNGARDHKVVYTVK
jgi:hypothetical protein